MTTNQPFAQDRDAILASVIAASLDCIVVIDEDGCVVEFNPAAEQTFGYARSEAIGKPIAGLIIPPHHRDAHAHGFARYLAGGEPRVIGHRVEVEAMRSDGSILPVELAITEVSAVNGRRLFTASLRDLSERRAAEAALRASEARLAAFFEFAPAGMFLKSRDGVYERVNAYTETMMGRSAAEIVGRSASDLWIAESAKKADAIDREVVETGEPKVMEQVYDNGERITHALTARFPIRDAQGAISHIGVVLIDISDRLDAEHKLRDSEARLSAFLDHAPAAMYLKDHDDRYALVNRFLAGRFGKTPEEVIGLRPAEVLDAAAAAEAEEVDRQVRQTGQPDVRESEFETAVGRRSATSIRFPVTDETGQIRYIGGVILDTTERTEAERKLRESEARLAAFMQHAPLTMFLKDSEGRYLLANHQAATNLGRAVEEIIGRRVQDVAPFGVADTAARIEREVLKSGKPRTDEEQFDLPVGRIHGLNTRFPVPDASGQLTQIGGVFVDITAQKNAEAELARSREALAQSEKLTALGSLLAGVSHELNNPLAVVVGEAILLEEDAQGSEFAASAQRIRRSAERCSRIVQTFLAMARQRKPERVQLDVAQVARSAAELTDYGMRSNGVTIVTEFGSDVPPVAADSDQLHQVIVNLLLNAQQVLQEQPQPREIRIATRHDRATDRVCIEVSDNGPGIPADIANRIFEPFFTTKPQGSGTGIGLSFSQGVVEAHGGTLSVASSEDGATFVVELPVQPDAAQPEVRPVEAMPSATAQARALIIDDEPELAATLERFLTREGYEVTVSGGGREAIEIAAEQDFDIIISDLRMPDVDGAALLAWLRQERPELAERLAFVTGDTLSAGAISFLQQAGRPYIEKPFTRDSVRELLARLSTDSGR